MLPRRLLVLLAVSTMFVANAIAQQGGNNKMSLAAAANERTSIIRILANPESFDGKRVSIVGFFHFEFEESAIYLHKVDADQELTQNSIWIKLPHGLNREAVEKLNNHYVLCEGQFSAENKGHMGLSSGEISDVRAISIWPSRADFEKMNHPQTQP